MADTKIKYIGVGTLLSEIERRIKETKSIKPFDQFWAGQISAFKGVRTIITSLQQEQPEPSCKSCGFYENNCPFIRGKFIPYPNKVCKDYTYSVMQEQPEVDLEKEIDNYIGNHFSEAHDGVLLSDASRMELSITDIAPMARHFAEWGATHLNARKEE